MHEDYQHLEQDQEHPTSEGTPEERVETAARIGRRDFLQVGLLGAVASCAGLGSTAETDAAPAVPDGGARKPPPQQEVAVVKFGDPETWNEPWVWRPSDWPGQQLHLNVVENQNPGPAVGFGNPNAILFSYGGNTPGPTVRMKGDEILHVKLRNLLGRDFGETFVGPYPGDMPGSLSRDTVDARAEALGNKRTDFCLGEHTNGVHSVRVTNLHTHGLHVRPSRNPNGTHSDNVILRVLSQADFNRREEEGAEASCRFLEDPDEIYFLRDDEQAGEADYEFHLGDVQRKQREAENRQRAQEGRPLLPPQPHPAGTFWYHPHAHGATHNQVASGMAGFLIVEGDIDETVNVALTNEPNPAPTLKTGDYDYRERLMFVQRVLGGNRSEDPDAPLQRQGLRAGATPLVNGDNHPATLTMRPGAVERWRVINGSVDGRGYKRFMVVKGQYTVQNRKLFEVGADGKRSGPITFKDLEALEAKKQNLYQLSIDGVTLVTGTHDDARYTIKDLSTQNAGTANPLWTLEPECQRVMARELGSRNALVREAADVLCRLRNVWKNGENVKNCYVRPNEFYMGPANRTDVFFQAPPLSSTSRVSTDDQGNAHRYEVYSVLAKTVVVHSDTPRQSKQMLIQDPTTRVPPSPEDVVIAYVLVSGEAVRGTGNPVLEKALPKLREVKVQEYLLPVADAELVVTNEEVGARTNVPAGSFRSRLVTYTGLGIADYPLVSTYPGDPSHQAFAAFIREDQTTNSGKLENLVYAQNGQDAGGNPYYVLLPPHLRSMAIKFNNANVARERAEGQDENPFPFQYPTFPRKFDPSDPYRARMLEDTAEEWALYNLTDLFWGNTTKNKKTADDPVDEFNDPTRKDYKQPPTQFSSHYLAYPFSRREGQQFFDQNHDFRAVTKGIDHPFHIHQNPFWVMRIEIPDETGALTNILDEPRWMDTIWIPRHRGRVVFRSRFPDYVGAYVHHCHILLHEDNGMMNVIEATPFAAESNYQAQTQVARAAMRPEAVSNDVYPRPSRDDGYVESTRFFDPDETTGQVYPGFDLTPPALPA